jgi:alanine racemase
MALYIGNPYGASATKLPITLLPVVGLTSKIIDIHLIKDEAIQKSIGYGATHKLKPGMITATIPVGYGDGYPRSLGNKGYCYINGVKVNIIGRVSMDLICLDISNVLERFQKIGQEVELIGDNISVEKIARLANTIDYEVLTSLGNRYIRKYVL